MPLIRRLQPFSDPDWAFEIKWDGFRALAHIENGLCRLVSRKGNEFRSFPALNIRLPLECRAQQAIIDGEIVCLDDTGNSQFANLLLRRGEPRFYAFDLLACHGDDLRYLPLGDRKHQLRGIVSQSGERLLYSDHVELAGEEFFQLACERDLEGIVAKRKFDPYLLDGSATWFKIRNPTYSQWIGREELFDRDRDSNPDWQVWNLCTSACDALIEAHGEI